MNHFIFVVDGEVAGEFPLPKITNGDGDLHPALEKLVAILRSNPQIVESEMPIEEGYMWDGEKFIPPVE